MAQPKSRHTKKQQEMIMIRLYLLFSELNPPTLAAILGIPLRTFYADIAKVRAEKGGSK